MPIKSVRELATLSLVPPPPPPNTTTTTTHPEKKEKKKKREENTRVVGDRERGVSRVEVEGEWNTKYGHVIQ